LNLSHLVAIHNFFSYLCINAEQQFIIFKYSTVTWPCEFCTFRTVCAETER